jgi:hypothetical protein
MIIIYTKLKRGFFFIIINFSFFTHPSLVFRLRNRKENTLKLLNITIFNVNHIKMLFLIEKL